jgi:hypothetical protein
MEYIFKKTEQHNLKASTFETKSLLFLASQNPKFKDISVLTIDCFNDVSGMCKSENLWDVQAKNQQNMTPRKIGQFLVTLLENYLSNFHPFFKEYIFFMPVVKSSYVINNSLPCYGINNFSEPHKTKLTNGLIETSNENFQSKIVDFLAKVLFVEDRSKEEDYVRGLMRFKSSKLNDELFFNAIFKEIRDKQTALKNSEIEHQLISRPNEVLSYGRHITTEALQVFVLNRFVGGDVFTNPRGCPASYIRYTRNLKDDEIEDHIFKQNCALSRAFFDKNNQFKFWQLFAGIFKKLCDGGNSTVAQIVNSLDSELINRVEHMDSDSTRFLVSMIKDGYKNEN